MAPSSLEPDPATCYAEQVAAGKVVAGKLVRQACERHLRDLKDGPARGLKWDVTAANRAVGFFRYLSLEDDRPFELEPFQKFVTGSLFGWKAADGTRRFRTAYCEQGKGNGKSAFAAGVGLYGLVADDQPSAEVYSAATTREQAGILFRDAKRMASRSPHLAKRLDVQQNNIAHPSSGSYFRPVSSEHRGLDGKRVHFALIDEIHEHPTPMVVDKMRAGTKTDKQALILEITNSGYDRNTVCWHHHEYSVKVLAGLIEDDSWFAYVCQLDPCAACEAEGKTQPSDGCPDCDSWQDESTWLKANPGLDTILPRKYIREQVHEAKGMPTKESIVRRLNFCQWTEAAVHAIPMDKWDACAHEIDPGSLAGRECYAGLDIGATSDFTALALWFPHDDGESIDVPVNPADADGPRRSIVRRSYTLLPFFWLPERPLKRGAHMEEVVKAWQRKGLVRTTPGDVVDYEQVVEEMVALGETYQFRKIGFDRGFQGASTGTALVSHFGDDVESVAQGILSMNAPFRELIELVIQGRVHHNGDPVLRWMVSNCAAEVRGGLMKPSKDHSAEKIDIVTAAVMGLAVAMKYATEVSWYTPGCLLDR